MLYNSPPAFVPFAWFTSTNSAMSSRLLLAPLADFASAVLLTSPHLCPVAVHVAETAVLTFHDREHVEFLEASCVQLLPLAGVLAGSWYCFSCCCIIFHTSSIVTVRCQKTVAPLRSHLIHFPVFSVSSSCLFCRILVVNALIWTVAATTKVCTKICCTQAFTMSIMANLQSSYSLLQSASECRPRT